MIKLLNYLYFDCLCQKLQNLTKFLSSKSGNFKFNIVIGQLIILDAAYQNIWLKPWRCLDNLGCF